MSASSPPAFGDRLLSLDAFRGFTMLLLVSHGFGIHAAFRGQWTLADQFEHAAWVGCTLWDLIQPAFTFIVGVAMPLALGRRTAACDDGGNGRANASSGKKTKVPAVPVLLEKKETGSGFG